jgi:hypothetical protein
MKRLWTGHNETYGTDMKLSDFYCECTSSPQRILRLTIMQTIIGGGYVASLTGCSFFICGIIDNHNPESVLGTTRYNPTPLSLTI